MYRMKRIGIAGATGLVGETLIRVLESGPHDIAELRLFASERSAGTAVRFRDTDTEVRTLDPAQFDGLDIAFTCLDAALSRKFVPRVAKRCPVIDKSSCFRLEKEVPLVVPEVNAGALQDHGNIIANPNCTTIPLCVAVGPLAREFGLIGLDVATYQSVSGAGRDALDQYRYETEFLALGQDPDTEGSPLGTEPIADNLIPCIGPLDRDGHCEEELKLGNESRKILDLPGLKVNATCVRVPVAVGHCLAVTCRFESPVSPKKASGVLKQAPGLKLLAGDDLATPARCRDNDTVYVGRLRAGADKEELILWVATDNLRKGAATNAVQIAELLPTGGSS